jgi:hypothetical protein
MQLHVLQALQEEMQAKTQELEKSVEELSSKLKAQEISTAKAIADRDSVKRESDRQVRIHICLSGNMASLQWHKLSSILKYHLGITWILQAISQGADVSGMV